MSTRTQSFKKSQSIIAYKLSKEGFTHKQIARQLGLKSEQVKGLVIAGSRLTEEEGRDEAG